MIITSGGYICLKHAINKNGKLFVICFQNETIYHAYPIDYFNINKNKHYVHKFKDINENSIEVLEKEERIKKEYSLSNIESAKIYLHDELRLLSGHTPTEVVAHTYEKACQLLEYLLTNKYIKLDISKMLIEDTDNCKNGIIYVALVPNEKSQNELKICYIKDSTNVVGDLTQKDILFSEKNIISDTRYLLSICFNIINILLYDKIDISKLESLLSYVKDRLKLKDKPFGDFYLERCRPILFSFLALSDLENYSISDVLYLSSYLSNYRASVDKLNLNIDTYRFVAINSYYILKEIHSLKSIMTHKNYTIGDFITDNWELHTVNDLVINYYKGLDNFNYLIEAMESRIN